MDIESSYAAAKLLAEDLKGYVTYKQFIREAEFQHPAEIENQIPSEDKITINCEEFYLLGGSLGNPSIIQFDALGYEQNMIDYRKDDIAAYYKDILVWPNIREEFLAKHSPAVYWLKMWQSMWNKNIGNLKLYTAEELSWLANTDMLLGRKLLAMASGLTTPEAYQPMAEAPDMYLMSLMSVPNQGKYHQYKIDWQPEHGPFMLLKDSGLREIVMHKLINEGKVSVMQTTYN